MNPSGGAATQICAHRFDRLFFALPADLRERIAGRIDEFGRDLRGFPHCRMQGVEAFRLRVGDYRIIYEFDVETNELYLIAVGNRRDIYKQALSLARPRELRFAHSALQNPDWSFAFAWSRLDRRADTQNDRPTWILM
jgi:mRNA interferase RelE/StbE